MKPDEYGKPVKVNCSFCSNEMECPKDMLSKSKKHMCHECFMTTEPSEEEQKDIHVDIPLDKMPDVLASRMADHFVAEIFPDMWTRKKNDLKEMSKKDIAIEMFGAGVFLGVKKFMENMRDIKNKKAADTNEKTKKQE